MGPTARARSAAREQSLENHARPAQPSAGEAAPRELGVCAYGPDSYELADRVVSRIEAWAGEQPASRTTIEIYLIGATAPQPGESLLTVTKEHTMIAIRATQ